MDKIIQVNNVTKTIKNKTLVEGVSLDIKAGTIVGLVGRNGSGKTVLLKLICGLFVPSEGTVIVNGKTIGKDIDFPDNIGIIIETPGFLPELSGLKNLELLACIRKKIDKKQIEDSIRLLGLDPKDRKPVAKYSLGMRQRLGLAQAIMENPDILILDEPFNGMDTNGIEEIRNLLLSLKKQGKTIVIASHVAEDIRILCDHVYKMKMGKAELVY